MTYLKWIFKNGFKMLKDFWQILILQLLDTLPEKTKKLGLSFFWQIRTLHLTTFDIFLTKF